MAEVDASRSLRFALAKFRPATSARQPRPWRHRNLPSRSSWCRCPAEPLTAAELRILKLLPTSTYLQMADTLYISHNTVKVHLRSVYQKLGVTSRSQAIQRAVDLRLL
jgi:DNA-binding CsgD family transcriptional regulator